VKAFGMTLANQLQHAWVGAARELGTQRGVRRVWRAFRLLLLVLRELLGTARLAPYAARALLSLRELEASKRVTRWRYGPHIRNCIDVILPSEGAGEVEGLRPVVIFVNGGVWATGDSWQFAPLARRLADEAGAIVCIATYTLYPATTVPTMVDEVSAAIEFAKGAVLSLGGDPARLTVLGHSAGAHLALSALLQLAQKNPPADSPVAYAFVGMAGVYDVALHYEFETGRGVNNLSTMEAAMGGKPCFAGLSPALQLPQLAAVYAPNLPPLVLMSSHADSTVPASQSQCLLDIALAKGLLATHVTYESTTHVDFATSWDMHVPAKRCRERPQLLRPDDDSRRRVMAHVADVVTVVRTKQAAQLRQLVGRHRAALPVARIPLR
jgi:acetyl esterase/lipase